MFESTTSQGELALPDLPAKMDEFVPYISSKPEVPMAELLQPYKKYDAKARAIYAQRPDHPAVQDAHVNVVPIFNGHEKDIKIRARDLSKESEDEKSKYLMPLANEARKPHDTPAVVSSLQEFQHNFSIFTENSLAEMDWSNVVAAGSSVVTSLLPVPSESKSSIRALRTYYHEKIAPASDVDLFIYGLTEEQAKEKIKDIESRIEDSILHDTTTIRTKHTITIVSQYPTRHVQIVLRIYKNLSEILTGFDVDCSCVAYDGSQVWAAPRAIASYMTQTNPIDLTRRSPSYENRLAKYSQRGFEVHWPLLDRSRIDPTIFEQAFRRTQGLARLLVLEKLPTSSEREEYANKRREERGRPRKVEPMRKRRFDQLHGNIKTEHENEIAEWDDFQGVDVSNYHTLVRLPTRSTFATLTRSTDYSLRTTVLRS
jgi:hypothetical protein